MDMYESEAKRKWQKENTVFIGVKLQKGDTDKDILSFLQDQKEKGIGYQTVIKLALREYIANHPVEEPKPFWEELED
jgi:uncharacterized protein (DUF4415 family)